MIRLTDSPPLAQWARPAGPALRPDARSPLEWFPAAIGNVRIAGDPNPVSRGLSVERHANLVLGHLRDERDMLA